jgi:hypothetical protein
MITNTEIGTTSTTIYTSSGDNAVNLMVFCNTNVTETGMLSVWVIPKNDTQADKHTILKNTRLTPTETLTFSTEKLILQDGDLIKCRATKLDDTTAIVTVVATVSSIAL